MVEGVQQGPVLVGTFFTTISAPRVVNWWPHISFPVGTPDLISSRASRCRS